MNPDLGNTSYAFAMSSANGTILGASATLYTDMIEPFSKKQMADKKKIFVLSVISALVIVLSVAIALFMQNIVDAMDVAYAYLSGCMFVPMVCGMLVSMVIFFIVYAVDKKREVELASASG